jgi:LacI family repressor for deo operon, udp, cdd, tsx, nupC, and nupG
MPRPTINDVARAAGVSKGAVSFALNDRPGVAPDSRARALSTSRALAVGLVLARSPEVLRADAFFPAFIAGLETVLSRHDHALLLQVAEHDDVGAYRRLAGEGRVDGVIVTDLQLDDPRPALLTELGLPFVVIGPHPREAVTTTLGVDDGPGVRAAVQHLVDLGHRDVAHVSGPQTMVHGRSRRTAWEETLRDNGLTPGHLVEADFSAASGARATRTLLDLPTPPTAIVYANDLMAMAGLSLAVSRGVRVPEQLSITGYDDLEISAHLQPALTSISTDVVAWGRAAATRLLALIDGTDTPPPDLEPARLVVRGSTGRAPQ